MNRYFIEVAYKGTNYSGFQIQNNANSIQGEIGKALKIFFKCPLNLTGASRTDAGVHALQNYFHFDTETVLVSTDETKYLEDSQVWPGGKDLKGAGAQALYSLNALLPRDIVIKKIIPVNSDAHCRFDAVEREYNYHIYQSKNPFVQDWAYYYPFKIDAEKLHKAADQITKYNDFSSFSKRNTQVKNFICTIHNSHWRIENESLIYHITANRFLRGMVRGIVGTMLRVARDKISIEDFRSIIENKDSSQADFSVPAQGLFLISVKYH